MRKDRLPASARISLLDCLQRLSWQGRRVGLQSELRGLCPFHRETHPSFYVNPAKNVFYCHGCGRGGGMKRFLQLAGELFPASPPPSIASGASSWMGCFPGAPTIPRPNLADRERSDVLEQALAFYQAQLSEHSAARHYLAQRGVHHPVLIAQLGIGYGPGGSLRRHLLALGYRLNQLVSLGLVDRAGRDAFQQRIVFPLRDADGRLVNLYGRSLHVPPLHRLLPGSKGGLFAWHLVQAASTILLVEGLFDLAALWQLGFTNTTCALGTHLSPPQMVQLCHQPGRRVSILFDQDDNGAGQQAALQCAQRIGQAGLIPSIVSLPAGHDPSSYCASGATFAHVLRLLEEAQ